MSGDPAFLIALCAALALAALMGLRPVIAARARTRQAGREARRRAVSMHEELERLREGRKDR